MKQLLDGMQMVLLSRLIDESFWIKSFLIETDPLEEGSYENTLEVI